MESNQSDNRRSSGDGDDDNLPLVSSKCKFNRIIKFLLCLFSDIVGKDDRNAVRIFGLPWRVTREEISEFF